MNRNELLHRLAEGETVSVHDVDECIREEKALVATRAIEWIYDNYCDGRISFYNYSSEELKAELESYLTR